MMANPEIDNYVESDEQKLITILKKRIAELENRVSDLSGITIEGVEPYTWPPNRRTIEDSNDKAISLMRQHVASYRSIDAHKHNCLDLCRRLDEMQSFEIDARRWRTYASSPQTALYLGSELDPNSEQDWVTECNRLVDLLTDMVSPTREQI